jgi:uncharacterized membrane protein (UPF0136 family)
MRFEFMHSPASSVLWVYIVLLVIGGLIGFLKARSKASLIASSAFAIALALCNVGIVPFADSVWIFIVLGAFFTLRLAKSKKFMPNGLMLALTILALALPHFLR